MSNADDGRNISVDEGAVCGRCNKFCGLLIMLELFKDANGCSEASSNSIGIKIFGIG